MRALTIAALLLLPAAGRADDAGPIYLVQLHVWEGEPRDTLSNTQAGVVPGHTSRLRSGQIVTIAGRDTFAGFSADLAVEPGPGGLRLDLRVDYSHVVFKAGRTWIVGSPAVFQRVVQPGVPVRFIWRLDNGPARWVEATVTARE